MRDRTKIQLLLEEGAIRKINQHRLPATKYTGEGMQEIFQLTDLGEREYFTIRRAMKTIGEKKPQDYSNDCLYGSQ